MMALASMEVRPCVQQNASTMSSHLRDLTWMTPPMFLWSKLNVDPKEFLDEVYKIIYSMGVSSIEKSS